MMKSRKKRVDMGIDEKYCYS